MKEENKKKKKLLSLFICFAMVLSALPASVFATGATIASGTCGDNLTWTLDDEGTLTISGTGAMYDWTYSPPPWYSNRSSIKHIIIGDSVTTIGEYAFCDCDSLTSVEMGDSVTTIGASAFRCCYGLTSVEIPDSVTTIGYWAFEDCGNLESVYITDLAKWCGISCAAPNCADSTKTALE